MTSGDNSDLMRRLGTIEAVIARDEEMLDHHGEEIEALKAQLIEAGLDKKNRGLFVRFLRERGARLFDAVVVALLALLTARGCDFHVPAAKASSHHNYTSTLKGGM